MKHLVEYRSERLALRPEQIQVLRTVFGADVLATETPGEYDVRPTTIVGTARTSSGDIVVVPRFGVRRALHLMSGALAVPRMDTDQVPLTDEQDLVAALAQLFPYMAQQALERGIVQGYHEESHVLPVLRGRVNVAAQVSRSYGRTAPLHVTYDEFDEDILPNRLIKAACHELRFLGSHQADRIRLVLLNSALAQVSLHRYHPSHVPVIEYRPQDEHLRPAVELARLILSNRSPELAEHPVSANTAVTAITFDMATIFEAYIRNQLREHLGLTASEWPPGSRLPRPLSLGVQGELGLEPDLSWWSGTQCLFVGDVKYKAIRNKITERDDVTQVLAYTIATGMGAGLIVAASGPQGHPRSAAPLRVRHLGTQIYTANIDLTVPSPSQLDTQSAGLADLVRNIARGQEAQHTAAP